MIQSLYLRMLREGKYNILAVLSLSALFSLGMVTFRFYLTGEPLFSFLAWNLVLAVIPLGIALIWNQLFQGRWSWKTLLLGAVWLLFFPNSPYILTDLFHLRSHSEIPKWFDLMMILNFAWTGMVAGFLSLREMQNGLERRYKKIVSWAFVLFSLGAASLGVFLGRYLRWNSWDIMREPGKIMDDVLAPFLSPGENVQTVGFVVCFFGFLFLGYLTFLTFSGLARNPRELPEIE